MVEFFSCPILILNDAAFCRWNWVFATKNYITEVLLLLHKWHFYERMCIRNDSIEEINKNIPTFPPWADSGDKNKYETLHLPGM